MRSRHGFPCLPPHGQRNLSRAKQASQRQTFTWKRMLQRKRQSTNPSRRPSSQRRTLRRNRRSPLRRSSSARRGSRVQWTRWAASASPSAVRNRAIRSSSSMVSPSWEILQSITVQRTRSCASARRTSSASRSYRARRAQSTARMRSAALSTSSRRRRAISPQFSSMRRDARRKKTSCSPTAICSCARTRAPWAKSSSASTGANATSCPSMPTRPA